MQEIKDARYGMMEGRMDGQTDKETDRHVRKCLFRSSGPVLQFARERDRHVRKCLFRSSGPVLQFAGEPDVVFSRHFLFVEALLIGALL